MCSEHSSTLLIAIGSTSPTALRPLSTCRVIEACRRNREGHIGMASLLLRSGTRRQ